MKRIKNWFIRCICKIFHLVTRNDYTEWIKRYQELDAKVDELVEEYWRVNEACAFLRENNEDLVCHNNALHTELEYYHNNKDYVSREYKIINDNIRDTITYNKADLIRYFGDEACNRMNIKWDKDKVEFGVRIG